MAKKGGATQLQAELNDDEEWDKYLQKSGSLLIDVYSDWSGPCSSMIATLKKVKMEIGGDILQLAIAKSDTITALERFRGTCEPTWMFIMDGKMTNLMYGANAPKLTLIIADELKKYQAVQDGTIPLVASEISELSAEEQVRYDAKKAIEDEVIRIETERADQQLREQRTAVTKVVLENIPNNGVIVLFPMVRDKVKHAFADRWEPGGLKLAAQQNFRFTEANIEELLYFTDYEFPQGDLESLLSGDSIVYLVVPRDMDAFNEAGLTIDQAVLEFVYGEMRCAPGSPDSIAERLTTYLVVQTPEPQIEESGLGLCLDDLENMEAQLSQAELEPQDVATTDAERDLEEGEEEDTAAKGSKAQVDEEKVSVVQEEIPVIKEIETYPVSGVWAPSDLLTIATAITLMFPKVYGPIALPPPVIIPPHVAVAFEVFKKQEISHLMEEYPDDIMRYGFFTSDNPATAKLLAKNLLQYNATSRSRGFEQAKNERMVIQLSKKKSEAWFAFSQLDPTFMSFNTVEGEQHCKMFFPEEYDEEIRQEVVEVKKKKKKGKKAAAAAKEAKEEKAGDEITEEGEEGEDDLEDGGDEEEEAVGTEDKGTEPEAEF